MVTSVASLGRKCAHAFIKHGVIDRLSYLLLADSMASSLKLMALRALDNLIDYPQGMEQLLGWSSSEFEGDTTYQLLLQLALTKPVSACILPKLLGLKGCLCVAVCTLCSKQTVRVPAYKIPLP